MLDACQEKNLQSYIFMNAVRFEDDIRTSSVRLRKVIEEVGGANECKQHAGGEVVPTMREHAGEEILSQQSDAAEERAIDADENDAAYALIAVGSAKDQRGEHDGDRKIAQQRDALRLEIAAKDQLFGESDDQTEQAPGCDLDSIGGRELHELASHLRLLLLRRFFLRRPWSRLRWIGGLARSLMLINFVLNYAP